MHVNFDVFCRVFNTVGFMGIYQDPRLKVYLVENHQGLSLSVKALQFQVTTYYQSGKKIIIHICQRIKRSNLGALARTQRTLDRSK